MAGVDAPGSSASFEREVVEARRMRGDSGFWLGAARVSLALFAIAVFVLSIQNPPTSYESAGLLLALNLVFTTFVSFFIAILAARTFVATGQANLLSLCCAMLIWGISAWIAATGREVGNQTITIHNLGVLSSALCHLTAVALTLRPPASIEAPARALALGCASSTLLVALIWMSSAQGWMPTFFVQGSGGTPLRSLVLYASVTLLAVAAIGLWVEQRQQPSAFIAWYGLGLAMLCIGIFGVTLQTVHGGLLGWTARAAQYLAGMYMLAGAVAALRDPRSSQLPLADALLKVRDEFEVLLRSINDGVVVYELGKNNTTKTVRVNAMACRLLGYSQDEIAHASLDEIVVFQDEAGRSGVESLRDTQVTERTLLSKSGRHIIVEVSARTLDHRHHRVTLLVIRDISDRKRAENALRESEQQLRLISDTASVYLARVDLDRRYLFVNKSYAARFGLEPDALIGKQYPEVVGEQAYAAFKPYIDRALAGETVEFDISIPYKSIGTRYIHATYVPERDAGGQIRGFVAAVTDISARKDAEDRLRQADRRKDEFLAMLGHELRNPLAPIRTAVEIMRRVGADAAKLEQARAIIERQTEHLARIVDDLLDVSRITQGKIALRMKTLDLEVMVRDGIETARPLIEARRHALNVAPAEQRLYVRGDAVRLSQVFANLLQNAAKYTPDGGRIEVWTEVAQQTAKVYVRDNGIGIEKELLPHVFDLFAQAERATDRAQGGLGIGLTIVRKLVELHGGRVSASSDGAGRGSVFAVELPMVTPADGAPTESPDAVASVRSRKILVVDDNVDSADSMAAVLQLDGHDTRVAYQGLDAVEIARVFQPEVVLLDIGLPGLDGYEVAQRLRAMRQTQSATLIALTGYGQADDQRRAQQSGFHYHLVKPVDLDALSELIHTLENRSGQ